MNLEQRINDDFLAAYKAKDFEKKNFLGVLKSEIENAKKLKSYREDTPLTILKTMKKSLNEGASRGDEKSKKELTILEDYLPKLISEEKIKENVLSIINEGITNIGLIMQAFNTRYKGQADNTRVKQIAQELLK